MSSDPQCHNKNKETDEIAVVTYQYHRLDDNHNHMTTDKQKTSVHMDQYSNDSHFAPGNADSFHLHNHKEIHPAHHNAHCSPPPHLRPDADARGYLDHEHPEDGTGSSSNNSSNVNIRANMSNKNYEHDDADENNNSRLLSFLHQTSGSSWSGVQLILLGQMLALLLTGTGVFSQLLAEKGVNIPTTQSFINYLLLSSFAVYLYHTGQPLHMAWWKYALLAVADVEGNYCLVRAYQYTSITSVQLLDCFTIPCVMMLSYFLLSMTYTRKHYIGCLLCVIGLGLLVLSDIWTHRNGDDNGEAKYGSILIGDLLVMVGCIFYSASNVGQEIAVKNFPWYEFVGMIGVFGTVISGLQALVLERKAIMEDVDWEDAVVWAYMLGFTACLFMVYALTPHLVMNSSAVFLNLSFLTADFWSILFGVYLFGSVLNPLYFFAFGLIIVGLVTYNVANVHADEDGELYMIGEGGMGELNMNVDTTTSTNRHSSRAVNDGDRLLLSKSSSSSDAL